MIEMGGCKGWVSNKIRTKKLEKVKKYFQTEDIQVKNLQMQFKTINEHFNNEFDKMHKNDLAG